MSKHFRPWNIDQTLLLPPSVQDFVPKDHVSRFIVGLVRESLDFKEIAGSYVSGLGQPPFDPRMMVALLLHGYASGLYSSRRIARACRERNDFVMIVALDPPDFRTISDFRKRHLKALGALFLQVLKLCEAAGLVKLGHVALDGTKIKANASKHKAMSYQRMKKRESELKAEVARMLAAAEAADAQEDETFGKDKRGDEMPDWAGDKAKRLAKIQEAMAALEADAKLAAEEERRIEAEKEKQRDAEGRKKPGKPAAPPSDEPDPKAQRNFTDPESRIMKSKDGFVQAYNAQAAVDADAQIIVAHELMGFPVETSIAVSRFILSGGPQRYPGIKMLVAHAGGVLPYLAARLDVSWRGDDEAQKRLTQLPSEALARLWLDSVVYHRRGLYAAADLVGKDRILFGTDHPFFKDRPADIFATVADAFSHDRATLEAVAAKNAVSFFNLPVR